MKKFSQTLTKKLSKMKLRFESFLENDFSNKNLNNEEEDAQFEVSQDMTLIRGLSQCLPEDHIDRTIIIFNRLSAFFEAGVLLENIDGIWKSQAYFNKGKAHLLPNSKQKDLALPAMRPFAVLTTNSETILEKLDLSQIDPFKQTKSILINVSPDFSFLLFSSMADLWLKDHTKNVHTELMNGFAE